MRFLAFTVFIFSLPAEAIQYDITNPFEPCSCRPAIISQDSNGKYFIEYVESGVLHIEPVSRVSHDIEAQTVHFYLPSRSRLLEAPIFTGIKNYGRSERD